MGPLLLPRPGGPRMIDRHKGSLSSEVDSGQDVGAHAISTSSSPMREERIVMSVEGCSGKETDSQNGGFVMKADETISKRFQFVGIQL